MWLAIYPAPPPPPPPAPPPAPAPAPSPPYEAEIVVPVVATSLIIEAIEEVLEDPPWWYIQTNALSFSSSILLITDSRLLGWIPKAKQYWSNKSASKCETSTLFSDNWE